MADDKDEGQSSVENILSKLRNSRLVAPFIAVAVVIIGLASFTTALDQLWVFAYSFLHKEHHYVVSAGGPTFVDPRLDYRTLDGCVLTMKSQAQGGDPDACNVPAQMEIASKFCLEAGYSRAVTFRPDDTRKFQHSYKMSEVLNAEGQMKYVWNPDERGGFIFKSITCN